VYVKFYLIYFRFAVVIAKRLGVALFSGHAVDYVLNNYYLPVMLHKAGLCLSLSLSTCTRLSAQEIDET